MVCLRSAAAVYYHSLVYVSTTFVEEPTVRACVLKMSVVVILALGFAARISEEEGLLERGSCLIALTFGAGEGHFRDLEE